MSMDIVVLFLKLFVEIIIKIDYLKRYNTFSECTRVSVIKNILMSLNAYQLCILNAKFRLSGDVSDEPSLVFIFYNSMIMTCGLFKKGRVVCLLKKTKDPAFLHLWKIQTKVFRYCKS